MIAGAQGWLLSILSVSMVCALADALMPQGAVRRVGRLVCGLVLMAAILAPVIRLDLEGGRSWLEDYLAGLDASQEQLRRQVDRGMEEIIEQRCAAYIVDKAAQLGIDCRVQIRCRGEGQGTFLPVGAQIWGQLTWQGQQELLALLEQDLGIPRESCIFISEEEAP